MNKSLFLFTALSLIPLSLSAQSSNSRQVTETLECPNNKDLPQICSGIMGRSGNRDPNFWNEYDYQTVIMKAACVDQNIDSEVEIRRKIQIFWKNFEDELTCNIIGFDVGHGDVIKYAVTRKFDDFIDDVANQWKIDLNRVDPQDGTYSSRLCKTRG